MTAGNYYVILGVRRDESPQGIRNAYLNLAKRYHPDVAGEERTRAFQAIREAFETLSDPERRRQYNQFLDEAEAAARRSRMAIRPEPLVAEPLSILHGPARYRPSLEALLERFLRNFTGLGVPKGEKLEELNLEVILTPEEALRGVVLPVEVPTFHVCPFCDGSGREWAFPCSYCRGEGYVETARTVRVRIPSQVRAGTVFELPLDELGVHNFYLRLHIFVER